MGMQCIGCSPSCFSSITVGEMNKAELVWPINPSFALRVRCDSYLIFCAASFARTAVVASSRITS